MLNSGKFVRSLYCWMLLHLCYEMKVSYLYLSTLLKNLKFQMEKTPYNSWLGVYNMYYVDGIDYF